VPSCSAPTSVDAELAIERMRSGRNGAVRLSARDPQGIEVHVVVKPATRLAMAPLEYLCEWVSSTIARALGVPTPEPYAVEIGQAFVDAISDAAIQRDFSGSLGPAFGSGFVTGSYTQMVSGLALTAEQRASAALLLAFDLFVHNVDRQAKNPNLFVHRDGFLALDHDQACSFVLPIIGAPDHVEDPLLDVVERHVFRHSFRRTAMPVAEIAARIAALDDPFFAEMEKLTPPAWTAGRARGKIEQIVDVLRKRRDAVNRWLPLAFARLTE